MSYHVEDNELTIDHTELTGPSASPTETISREDCSMIRLLKCAWADRLQLAKELVGYIESKGNDTIFHKPHPYPHEQFFALLAKDVTIQPFGGAVESPEDEQIAEYSFAQLTVRYETPDYELPDEGQQTYVTESLEPASEFVTLSTGGLKFGTVEDKNVESLDPTEAPSKINRLIEWVYTFHQVPTIPQAVLNLPGYINDAAVTARSLGMVFPAGTLLCGNPSLSRQITSEGITAWTVTMRFMYKNNGTFGNPKGWNYFPRTRKKDKAGEILFEQITDGTKAIPIYKSADFTQLVL